jgi:hypothetical protein
MAAYHAGPATPEDVARYGHIAALIKQKMAELRLSMADLHEKVGRSRSDSGGYIWLSAKGAPGPATRKKLARLFEVPESALKPRDLKHKPGKPQLALPVPDKHPARTVATMIIPPASPPEPILSYNAHGDGTVTIALNARLPVDVAKPLFRTLMDTGIDMGPDK